MVPKGWINTTFGVVTKIGTGQINPQVDPYASMAHIGPENIISNSGQLINIKTCKEIGLISGKYEFDENSIVYSKIRPNLNKVCRPNFRGVCSADMYPIWVKNGFLYNNYLYQYMLGPKFLKTAVAMSMRTGMPKINRRDLETVEIALPPLHEQKKIAQILSTWDKAITTTEQLLANSQQQKKALMQQLLTGKKRLLDENGVRFSEQWNYTEIKELLRESRITSNNSDPSKRLTVKLNLKGIEIRKFRGTEAINSTTHFIRKTGQFIYGKQNIHKGALGIIPPELNGFETSQDLPTFDFTEKCESSWFLHFMSQEHFLSSLESKMSGTGSKRLSPKVLLNIRILFPPLKEQQKITSVLSTADREITFLQQKLDMLKQEKKTLMQQLLTGKRRVKVEEAI